MSTQIDNLQWEFNRCFQSLLRQKNSREWKSPGSYTEQSQILRVWDILTLYIPPSLRSNWGVIIWETNWRGRLLCLSSISPFEKNTHPTPLFQRNSFPRWLKFTEGLLILKPHHWPHRQQVTNRSQPDFQSREKEGEWYLRKVSSTPISHLLSTMVGCNSAPQPWIHWRPICQKSMCPLPNESIYQNVSWHRL